MIVKKLFQIIRAPSRVTDNYILNSRFFQNYIDIPCQSLLINKINDTIEI